ncbi:hypothetical protein BOTBODRAFT_116879 [Botryobasidium botryosum FD-172 SS1]|uniref:AB hydrolase-1 domain-containing protein n=1 Tax=Botryobasidium botryosum (strain FD-172 SS1) TaxID=930990 RepID=A0A067MCH8_BOTB1|nr:hypothetical protein BOTBODRAFT_116879 [Botryobasidium botryosum FD-172 SS1]
MRPLTLLPFAVFALIHAASALLVSSKDGTQIWAEAKGNPRNPHFVWIHGYLLSSLVFDKLFEDETYLNNLYMVRYDIRGFGQSDKPLNAASYQSARFAEDFDAVVQAFNLHKPFAAGWSYGGTIFTDIYALHGNGVVSGFVYLAALDSTSATSSVSQPLALNTLPNLTQDANVTLYNTAEIGFVEGTIYHPSTLSFETRVAWIGLGAVIPQVVKSNLLNRTQDTTRLFAEGGPSLPVLYVAGLRDALLNDTALVELLRPKFKRFEVLTLPDSGHAVFLEGFEEVRSSVLQFVHSVIDRVSFTLISPSYLVTNLVAKPSLKGVDARRNSFGGCTGGT